MKKNKLLFSKHNNKEKSIIIGEEAKNSNEIFISNKTNSEKEQTFSYEVKSINESEKVNIVNLNEELEELKQQLKEERIKSISEINELNLKDIEKGKEMKTVFQKLVNFVKRLKKYDKNLILKEKFLTKIKMEKVEEEMKNDIKSKEAQIKFQEKKANYRRVMYEKSEKNIEKDKNKEKTLNLILSQLKSDLSNFETQVQKMKIIYKTHLKCEKEKNSLIDKYNILETDYKYELKKAKKLAKINLNEKDEEDAIIEEEYDQLSDEAKAEKDEKSLLPKLKVLKFRGANLIKLEKKIIEKNKIRQIKNESSENVKKLYKKIENIYKNNEHHFSKAKSYIRKNRKINIEYEDNYLFSENDAKIMEKVIPEKMMINYKNKFNDILHHKIEIEKKLNQDSNKIMNESEVISNNFVHKIFNIKMVQKDKVKLLIKSQKLKEKINNLKRNIKEIEERIKKEEQKILKNENKKINLYYKQIFKTLKKNKKC